MVIFQCFFPKFVVATIWTLRIPRLTNTHVKFEIALRHGCSPVNLLHFFRTPLTKNVSGWLLLWRLWMASSGNKCLQLYTTNAKGAYTGLYTYSNGFVGAWSLLLFLSCHAFLVIFERRNRGTGFWVLLYLFKKMLKIKSLY